MTSAYRSVVGVLCGVLALGVGPVALRAQESNDWVQFRGPGARGVVEETGLPTTWSTTDNVAWVANLPGAAASTPIVIGDRVFISTTNESAKKLMAFCLDRKSGKVLWKKQIGPGLNQDRRSNYAANSPAANSEVVVDLDGLV